MKKLLLIMLCGFLGSCAATTKNSEATRTPQQASGTKTEVAHDMYFKEGEAKNLYYTLLAIQASGNNNVKFSMSEQEAYTVKKLFIDEGIICTVQLSHDKSQKQNQTPYYSCMIPK